MQETICARVDSQLKEQFEFAAKSHGQKASQLLRDIMADYVHSTRSSRFDAKKRIRL